MSFCLRHGYKTVFLSENQIIILKTIWTLDFYDKICTGNTTGRLHEHFSNSICIKMRLDDTSAHQRDKWPLNFTSWHKYAAISYVYWYTVLLLCTSSKSSKKELIRRTLLKHQPSCVTGLGLLWDSSWTSRIQNLHFSDPLATVCKCNLPKRLITYRTLQQTHRSLWPWNTGWWKQSCTTHFLFHSYDITPRS